MVREREFKETRHDALNAKKALSLARAGQSGWADSLDQKVIEMAWAFTIQY